MGERWACSRRAYRRLGVVIAFTALTSIPSPRALSATAPQTASPRNTDSGVATGTLIGVEAIGVAGDVNKLISITVTRTGGAYSVSASSTGVAIQEDGWSESPRNSLSYKPYPKLLTGIGFIRAPYDSAGTLEIDPTTGMVGIHFLTEAGHGYDTADAAALAVSQEGRTMATVSQISATIVTASPTLARRTPIWTSWETHVTPVRSMPRTMSMATGSARMSTLTRTSPNPCFWTASNPETPPHGPRKGA